MPIYVLDVLVSSDTIFGRKRVHSVLFKTLQRMPGMKPLHLIEVSAFNDVCKTEFYKYLCSVTESGNCTS